MAAFCQAFDEISRGRLGAVELVRTRNDLAVDELLEFLLDSVVLRV